MTKEWELGRDPVITKIMRLNLTVAEGGSLCWGLRDGAAASRGCCDKQLSFWGRGWRSVSVNDLAGSEWRAELCVSHSSIAHSEALVTETGWKKDVWDAVKWSESFLVETGAPFILGRRFEVTVEYLKRLLTDPTLMKVYVNVSRWRSVPLSWKSPSVTDSDLFCFSFRGFSVNVLKAPSRGRGVRPNWTETPASDCPRSGPPMPTGNTSRARAALQLFFAQIWVFYCINLNIDILQPWYRRDVCAQSFLRLQPDDKGLHPEAVRPPVACSGSTSGSLLVLRVQMDGSDLPVRNRTAWPGTVS